MLRPPHAFNLSQLRKWRNSDLAMFWRNFHRDADSGLAEIYVRLLFPARPSGLLCDGAALGFAQNLRSGFPTFTAAHGSKGHGMRVSAIWRWCFKRFAIHLLTDGVFYDVASDFHKIALRA
jgi:hypothetical protein